MAIRVTVWNEFLHEQEMEEARAVYPQGIHTAIAEFLGKETDICVRTATLQEPENGLPEEVLRETDVLIWWGHMAHERVETAVVERVVARVQAGMGLIVLHSGHASRPFRSLMGTDTVQLRWREPGDKLRVWIVNPGHAIAQGLGDYFEVPMDEVYGELFQIPQPDELVFITWSPGGEVFRSGCCFKRGAGKIFYYQNGHETYPIYYQKEPQRVICNAVRWAAPAGEKHEFVSGYVDRLEA